MFKRLSLAMVMAITALGLTVPISAQSRSAVTVSELDAAVAEQPSAVRVAVQDFLATDRAQTVAAGLGMSVSELSDQVAALDDATLNALSAQAGFEGEAMAGGEQTIVITATTVIIILLLVLILVR